MARRATVGQNVNEAGNGFAQRAFGFMAGLPVLLLGGDGRAQATGAAIHEALGRLGVLLGVSRAYVMLDDREGRYMRNTHEWVSDDTEPAMYTWPLYEHARDIPTLKPMLEENDVVASHTRDLPEDQQRALRVQSVDSVLLVSIRRQGRWIGLLGVDMCGRERIWDEEEIALMRFAAPLVDIRLERDRYVAMREMLEGLRVFLNDTCDPDPNVTDPRQRPRETLEEAERRIIADALEACDGNIQQAAIHLGLSWYAMKRRCKQYGFKGKRGRRSQKE